MTPIPTSTVLSPSPDLFIQLLAGCLHLTVPQGPQNPASLRLNPWPSSPDIFLLQCPLTDKDPRHPLQVFPLLYLPHTIKLLDSIPKIFPANIYDNNSKLLEKLFVLSWYFLPCKRETKWTLSGHTWPLGRIEHSWNSLSPYSFSPGRVKWLLWYVNLGKINWACLAQLFSFLLLEVGLLCCSSRSWPFYLTWVCLESSIAETGWVSLSNSGDQLLSPFGSHTDLYLPTSPSSITTL